MHDTDKASSEGRTTLTPTTPAEGDTTLFEITNAEGRQLDPSVYADWISAAAIFKSMGHTLDEFIKWSQQSNSFNEEHCRNLWDGLVPSAPAPTQCPHVIEAKNRTIQELIKLGILTPALAMERLAFHPALNSGHGTEVVSDYAHFVQGELADVTHSLQQLQRMVHGLNRHAGWWTDLQTGQPKDRNDGELLMLMVSELAEGMEGVRKNLMDDKLPHRKMIEVELADCVIRILDYAGGRGLDLAGALMEKLAFNSVREDHTIAARSAADGKKF